MSGDLAEYDIIRDPVKRPALIMMSSRIRLVNFKSVEARTKGGWSLVGNSLYHLSRMFSRQNISAARYAQYTYTR